MHFLSGCQLFVPANVHVATSCVPRFCHVLQLVVELSKTQLKDSWLKEGQGLQPDVSLSSEEHAAETAADASLILQQQISDMLSKLYE